MKLQENINFQLMKILKRIVESAEVESKKKKKMNETYIPYIDGIFMEVILFDLLTFTLNPIKNDFKRFQN